MKARALLATRVRGVGLLSAMAPRSSRSRVSKPVKGTQSSSDSRRDGFSRMAGFEALAVVLTGALHLLLTVVLDAKLLFIGLASTGWAAYLAMRIRKHREVIAEWGFGANNLYIATRYVTAAAVLSVGSMAAYAAARQHLFVNWHMLPLMFAYPVWGLLQQFMVQALLAGNLAKARGWVASTAFVTLLSATLFSTAHFPYPGLMAATFLLGLVFTPMYLRWRNLWPFGFYHGVLAVFFYFWILNRDPWAEVFRSYAH